MRRRPPGRSVAPRKRASSRAGREVGCILRYPFPLPRQREHPLYFYELHEGDEEIFTDLLLVHEEQIEPEDFFELVQAVRANVQDTHEEDTLIEAIALELEREHGFTFVSDTRLEASVHVSPIETENRLIASDDEMVESAEYRSMLADFDPDLELDRSERLDRN